MFPGGRGMDPKRMAAMMKQMGIDMKDVPDVEEVVIRTKSKEIVITDAEVQRVAAQGSVSWQISGKATERPRASGAVGSGAVGSGAVGGGTMGTGTASAAAAHAKPAAPGPAEQGPRYTEDDIKLVMSQAKVDRKAAIAALEEADGETAEAIVALMEENADEA